MMTCASVGPSGAAGAAGGAVGRCAKLEADGRLAPRADGCAAAPNGLAGALGGPDAAPKGVTFEAVAPKGDAAALEAPKGEAAALEAPKGEEAGAAAGCRGALAAGLPLRRSETGGSRVGAKRTRPGRSWRRRRTAAA